MMFITWPGCNDLDKSSYTPIVVTMVEAKMTEFAQSHELRCMSPVMVTPWPAASDTTCVSVNSESVSTGPVHTKPTCRNSTTCPQWHNSLTNILIYSHSKTRHTLRKHWNICGLKKHAPSRSAHQHALFKSGTFLQSQIWMSHFKPNDHLFNIASFWNDPPQAGRSLLSCSNRRNRFFSCPTMHATNFPHYYTGLNSPVRCKLIVCLHYWYLTSS